MGEPGVIFRGSTLFKRVARTFVAAALTVTSMLPATVTSAQASNERSLYLHYTHTKETARIVFKRNGRYVQEGLNQLNVFLRDWRRNEPAKMDPALFDLLWEVYQETGSNQPIHVVSAYRSAATNAMLASNSSGVANNSQHMQGKAIDFYIPGVPASKLREIGFRKHVGGVGYYPSSGSPFVHLDTGSVRAWPRMTTAQLQQIFPDGKTMHIPSNGVPLSQEGYRLAQAEWQRCQRVPCSGASSASSTRVAENSAPRRTLMDLFTGGNNNDSSASQPAPAQTQTQTAQAPSRTAASQPTPQPPAPVAATPAAPAPSQQVADVPTPPSRPGALMGEPSTSVASAPETIPFAIVDAQEMEQQVAALAIQESNAPVPPTMSRSLSERQASTPSAYAPNNAGSLAIAALDDAPVPLRRPEFEAPVVAAAYAASTGSSVRIEENTIAPSPLPRPQAIASTTAAGGTAAALIETAALSESDDDLAAFASLFSGPIGPRDGVPDAATANALASLKVREGELHAPDVDHVTEMFLTSELLTSAQFGYMMQPDNADFSPATQVDSETHPFEFSRTASLGPDTNGFNNQGTILVTLR